MSREAQVVVEIWDVVRDFIPVGKRADIAETIVRAFADYGFEEHELAEIVDEDNDLSDAFESVFLEENDYEEYDE